MRLLLLLALFNLYLFANGHIFVYHRFGDAKYASANTSKEELRKQFEYFKQNSYQVVKLEQILDKLEKKEDIPDNWVALTIDDAYKSFYEHGLSIFKEYNYPFTLLVYVKATNEKYGDFMTWEQLREVLPYGSVELHSYNHNHMTQKSEEENYKDTKKSYDIFTKQMGYQPTIYAYPYGEYDAKVQKVVKSFGFRAILNQNSGTVNKTSDIHDINRVALVGDVNIKQKFKYKTFDVKWIEPQAFPKDNILKSVKAEVSKEIKSVKLYVSGHGWRDIKVNDGIIDLKLNLELKRDRTRVIIGKTHYEISNKIIIKNKEK